MSYASVVSGMPQITSAFNGWMKPITLSRVTQTVEDGIVFSSESSVTFEGTIQPLTEKAIALKPEGQRAWTWLQIHCKIPGVLDNNDIITYNGLTYKVMMLKDYSLNGFIEYHVCKDYQ